MKEKTKTKFIINDLANNEKYNEEIELMKRIDIKVLIMGRAGMLQCASNFKGAYQNSNLCLECKTVDNEKHRLNWCPKWQHNGSGFTNFDDIYSKNRVGRDLVIETIKQFWDINNGENEIRAI